MKPKIYIGTAGWSYKDWVPYFYPKNQSSHFSWLKYYSEYFNCVEINSSYYRYLSKDTVKKWVQNFGTDSNFKFTIKLHQDFTHKQDFNTDKLKLFKDILDVFKSKNLLGGVLIQFPYSFQFNENNLKYLKVISKKFNDYTKFIEVRHNSWILEIPLNFFKKEKLNFTIVDQPQIGNSFPFKPLFTGKKSYYRFHGRNVIEWKRSIMNYGKSQTPAEQAARYKYLYNKSELKDISNVILNTKSDISEVYVILNNYPSTTGLVNAFELKYILRNEQKVDIPENTLIKFPQLKPISNNNKVQQNLFD